METRIANAEHDSTYLLAKVEVVATYKLAGINRTRMENLFQTVRARAVEHHHQRPLPVTLCSLRNGS